LGTALLVGWRHGSAPLTAALVRPAPARADAPAGRFDPDSIKPSKGSARKAFCGLCMALVQSGKSAGSITVEATSPGLGSASVTVEAKATTLRPQVAAWEREVPSGSGITGLWRPVRSASGSSQSPFAAAESSMLFTLHQDGAKLTGSMENAAGGSFFGAGEGGTPIDGGKVDGDKVSFKVGTGSYAGTMKGEQIELQRTMDLTAQAPHPAEPAGPRPAIGPPPDGSDPSRGPQMRPPSSMTVVLRRVDR